MYQKKEVIMYKIVWTTNDMQGDENEILEFDKEADAMLTIGIVALRQGVTSIQIWKGGVHVNTFVRYKWDE